MVETCAPVSMRALTQISPKNISIIYPPNQIYCTIWLLILGTSDNFHWLGVGTELAQFLHSVWVLGEALLFLPLLEFTGLGFWVLEHLCHICPPALAVIALDLVLISPPSSLSLILIVSGCVILVTILPLGPLAIVVGT